MQTDICLQGDWFWVQFIIIYLFYLGDAIVDGGKIKWETQKQFEGLTDNEISALSLQDYEQLEAERMQKKCMAGYWSTSNATKQYTHAFRVYTKPKIWCWKWAVLF